MWYRRGSSRKQYRSRPHRGLEEARISRLRLRRTGGDRRRHGARAIRSDGWRTGNPVRIHPFADRYRPYPLGQPTALPASAMPIPTSPAISPSCHNGIIENYEVPAPGTVRPGLCLHLRYRHREHRPPGRGNPPSASRPVQGRAAGRPRLVGPTPSRSSTAQPAGQGGGCPRRLASTRRARAATTRPPTPRPCSR